MSLLSNASCIAKAGGHRNQGKKNPFPIKSTKHSNHLHLMNKTCNSMTRKQVQFLYCKPCLPPFLTGECEALVQGQFTGTTQTLNPRAWLGLCLGDEQLHPLSCQSPHPSLYFISSTRRCLYSKLLKYFPAVFKHTLLN